MTPCTIRSCATCWSPTTTTGSPPTGSSARPTPPTISWPHARRSPRGHGCHTGTWAAPRTTRRRSWPAWALTPTGTRRSATARGPGIGATPSGRCSSTMCSSTRPSTAARRCMRWRMSTSMSCASATTAWSCAAPRCSPPAPPSPTPRSWPRTAPSSSRRARPRTTRCASSRRCPRPGSSWSRARPMSSARGRHSTPRCPAALTRTTRWWCSTTCSFRGRTCSSTATSNAPPRSTPSRASCLATRCSRARAWRSSSTSCAGCSPPAWRPTAPTASEACRRRWAS